MTDPTPTGDGMPCPDCGTPCERDEVDNGIGMEACGPWGCPNCHWCETKVEIPMVTDPTPTGGDAEMTTIKNEHIVWAYADRQDGDGKVVFIGLTAQGLQYLKNTPGQTLLANPPGAGFANVTQIVVFHEKDKAALKERFRQAGVLVSEVN